MDKIHQLNHVKYNKMTLIPLDVIKRHHAEDYLSFETWMRGRTVILLGTDKIGIHVHTYEKWFSLFR